MSAYYLLNYQQKRIPCISELNIPEMMSKSQYNRAETIYIFSQYKVMLKLQSLNQNKEDVFRTPGVNFQTFFNTIFHIFLLGEEKAQILFNQLDVYNRGYLTEKEFLDAMKKLMNKTKANKIKLFMQIADSNGDGMLSYDEIFHLAYLTTKNNFIFSQ